MAFFTTKLIFPDSIISGTGNFVTEIESGLIVVSLPRLDSYSVLNDLNILLFNPVPLLCDKN